MNQKKCINALVNSRLYPLLLFFISVLFVVLFSRSTSFLYLFEGSDPSIFKQMGRAILKGKIIYIDYFDNKDCILYFIHALGLWLGGDFFILLMQAFSLTVTLFIWDKMLALYRDERSRLICICMALLLLLCFYGAGDQTQEWCLPFISYPLWVYFHAYKMKSEIRPLQMLFIGICFGVICFIQINNACAFLGFIAYLWFQYLLKKDFRKLLQSVGCFIAGWIIIAIPCILYFNIKAGWHGVYEMVYGSLLSNLEYMGNQWKPQWLHVVLYCMFIVALIALQIITSRKERDILVPFVISMCLFVATFGKLCNSFYLTALIPLCVVTLMTINLKQLKLIKLVFCGIALVSMVFYAGNIAKHILLQNNKLTFIYGDFHHCIENIPDMERDSIYNYNLHWHGTHMMEHENLLQSNRVLFTALVFQLPTLWKEEAKKPFIPPKWIMISFDMPYKADDANFILRNYDFSCSFHYDMEYFQKEGKGGNYEVSFYRRKY
jgi:hypothetical protein